MAYSKPRPIDCVLSSQPNQHAKSSSRQQAASSCAPDAGGVELQPRRAGTVSGGEGQAGTGRVSSHRSSRRKCFQNSATYKVKVDYVRKHSLDVVFRRYISGRRNTTSLARSATTCLRFVKLALCVCCLLLRILRATAVRVSQNERKARPR